jgi:hypothetical protein
MTRKPSTPTPVDCPCGVTFMRLHCASRLACDECRDAQEVPAQATTRALRQAVRYSDARHVAALLGIAPREVWLRHVGRVETSEREAQRCKGVPASGVRSPWPAQTVVDHIRCLGAE